MFFFLSSTEHRPMEYPEKVIHGGQLRQPCRLCGFTGTQQLSGFHGAQVLSLGFPRGCLYAEPSLPSSRERRFKIP